MNAVDYLTDKLSRIVRLIENNPDTKQRFNKGAKLLVESGVWRQNVDNWVTRALDDILAIHKVNSRNGQTLKLTLVSIEIGKAIAYDIGLDDTDFFVTIPIGDFILEGLLSDGTIQIEQETKAHNSPYVIRIIKPVYKKAVLKGTLPFEPKPIASSRNIFGKPFIKGWIGETREDLFKDIIAKEPLFVDALNNLRRTAWRLNKPVLEEIRAKRDLFVNDVLPLANKKGTIINFPVNENANDLKGAWFHPSDKAPFKKENDPRLQKIRSKNYEYEIIMLKAQEMPERFYQEYTCDYRGRIYCTESFLQFQGTDIARGLFLFDEAKEITDSGLKRLKVHIANCYNISLSKDSLPHYFTTDYKSILEEEGLEEISLDKLTLEDKILFVENNYWKRSLDPKAESPASLLAALNEFHNHATIEGYKSSLPIPVDGSNNGWQHLSAMSKDRKAAELVSCTDVKVQKDFYVAVAKEMIKQKPDWFDKRSIPMKHIRKGIAKRGAMTRAYSAGKARIGDNMYDDCHMYEFTQKYKINEDDCQMLAGVLIEAVNSVCAGPLRVTKWLQEIAHHEIEAGEKQLQWVTPSGFPVYYEQYQQKSVFIRSRIEPIGQIEHCVRVNDNIHIKNEDGTWTKTDELIPDRRSYASGIAPNVVHSFDASHMANVIVRFGKCFGAVHDSFSTHASDVDELLEITKDCFIEMYDVENWFDQFKTFILRHEGFEVPNPELGKYNVNEVRNATYFFC